MAAASMHLAPGAGGAAEARGAAASVRPLRDARETITSAAIILIAAVLAQADADGAGTDSDRPN